MQELNLTPTQTLILFFVLGLLGLLLSRSKSLIDIDLPEDTQSLNHVRTQTMGLIFNHRTIITIREELNDTTREL
ncbi:phage protein [Streptococcus pyogenes]|nr:phage protein [Streptococcus pyogenes]